MKPKTLLLLFLAVPILGYALVYAYIWFSTKSDLDRFAAQIAPVADFHYGRVTVGPTGSIAVRDLSLAPRQSGGTIRIDRVDLKTPGIDFLLTGARSLREGRVPRRLGLAFTGIRIDTDGPLWWLVSQQIGLGEQRRPDSALACDISSIVRMQGVAASLLPSQVVIDLEYLFEKGADPGTALAHIRTRQRGISDVSLDLQGQVGDRLADLPTTASLDSAVLTATLDPEYARQAVLRCAEESHVPVEQFLPTLLAQDDQAYLRDIGMSPGPGIRGLLQGYLSGSAVEVRVTKPAGLDLASVKHYRPEDVPRLLNIQAALDGVAVTDLSFKSAARVTAQPAQGSAQGSVTPSPQWGAPPSAAPGPRSAPAPSDDIAVADLAHHSGQHVLITLRDGRERRGLVDRVQNGVVYVQQQIQQGSVTMEVREADIAKVRLLATRPPR